jgi:hypothetical protein
VKPDVEIGHRLVYVVLRVVVRRGAGQTAASLQSRGRVVARPDKTAGRERPGAQFVEREHCVLRKEAVREEDLSSVDAVREAELDGAESLHPVDGIQVALLRSVVDDHEEVHVRVVVKPVKVEPDGAQTD